MSFRARLTLVAAAAVALAVVAASILVYVVVRGQLYGSVDDALRSSMERIVHGPDFDIGGGPPQPGVFGGYPQAVGANGAIFRLRGQTVTLPVTKRVLEVARGQRDTYFTMLVLIAGGGVLVAAGLGLAVSGAALAPVRRLTEATETVTETGDLSQRIEARGRDELSRLAASFNAMLGVLEESTRARRQLVADASHELRTPLTSLRTNIEVLASDRELPPGERERLLTDVVEQLGEMTTLISELIELARGEQHPEEAEDVRLDLVAADAVERARRNRPGISFKTELAESVVHGVPRTIERALANLIDNAAKWSPPGGEVEISVRDGEVTVRDHGPGIAEEDLPYVFDRFYRARSARGSPGSGLGLAIVRQVAEAHGGEVVAERAAGGGTLLRLRLDGASMSES